MTVSANFAANAYQAAMKTGIDALKDTKENGAVADPSAFTNMVKDAVSSIAEQGQKAEQTAANVASGKGDLVDLVTTIAETEVAIETLVTTRDRVISAYRDIMNMPI